MRAKSNWRLGFAVLLASSASWGAEPSKPRIIIPFDDNWRFSGPQAAAIPNAESPAFPDAGWRTLSVPHDWSIETPLDNNTAGVAGAFMSGGIGYYRKSFSTPPGQRVYADFDGVFQNATLYINGRPLGIHVYGYGSFREDLTGKLNAVEGAPNIIAVKVDDSILPSARWYAGAGIFRHVRLITTGNVHFEEHASFISTVNCSAENASLHLETSVMNHDANPIQVHVEVELIGPDGKPVNTTVAPVTMIAGGKTETLPAEISVANPKLWNFDLPAMYQAIVRIRPGIAAGGTAPALDEEIIPIGIRTTEFKPDTGFWINGKNIKLQGVCLHADGGGIGAAVPLGVWERRLAGLKQLGVNAVRTAHNAPDPVFLDLCDRMGFAVMHELFDTWESRKVPGDYARFFRANYQKDLTATIMRDRNHPSIVIYSAGNEIRDPQDAQMRTLADMMKIYHALDPTRPITQALFRPANGAYTNGHAAMLDVLGVNYRPAELVQQHREHPEYKTIGTEDNYLPAELLTLRDEPSLSGIFIWTGVDYLGEGKTPPSIAQGYGLLDRILDPRPRGYEHQSWWSRKPMVKIARAQNTNSRINTNDTGGNAVIDWTPATLAPHNETVQIHSNCDSVELFLNDISLGIKERPANWASRTWSVTFAPGILRAVAKNNGQVVAMDECRTAGKATKIKLTIDQPRLSPAWDDVSYLRAEIVDDQGLLNPNSADKITFTIEGPGIIAALDNADLDSHEMFRGNTRSAFRGKCIAIIKATAATGKITLTASADSLAPASVSIDAVPQ